MRYVSSLFIFLIVAPSVVGDPLEGNAFFCVGVQDSGEDFFYGVIFEEGKVRMLSFVKIDMVEFDDYTPKKNENVSYRLIGPNKIVWQLKGTLHEIDKRLLKHTADGGKRGFFRGLCFSEKPEDIEERLSRKNSELPR